MYCMDSSNSHGARPLFRVVYHKIKVPPILSMILLCFSQFPGCSQLPLATKDERTACPTRGQVHYGKEHYHELRQRQVAYIGGGSQPAMVDLVLVRLSHDAKHDPNLPNFTFFCIGLGNLADAFRFVQRRDVLDKDRKALRMPRWDYLDALHHHHHQGKWGHFYRTSSSAAPFILASGMTEWKARKNCMGVVK